MVEVLGIRGPAIYQIIDLPDEDVAAATDEAAGWAMLYEPGAVIGWDPNAPNREDWKVPGYYIPPELAEPPIEPPDPEPQQPVAIAFLANTNPTQVHVAVADATKFKAGDSVTIIGATGEFAAVAGQQTVAVVNTVIGYFTVLGVDTSAAAANDTTPGMTVVPAAPPTRN